MITEGKRRDLYLKFLEELIKLDRYAIADDVEKVEYSIEDYYRYLQIEKTLYGEKISIKEDLEISEPFKVSVTPSSREKVTKYTKLFEKMLEDFYKNHILPTIKLTTKSLKHLYYIGGDTVIATNKGFVQLFESNTTLKAPSLIYVLAYIHNPNNKYFENNETLKTYSKQTNFNNVVINENDKICLYLHKLEAIFGGNSVSDLKRTNFSKMPVVNVDTNLGMLNVYGDDSKTYNIFEKKVSETLVCEASGRPIVISEYFKLPDDVIKVDDKYYYKEAYKLWAISNKYKCKIERYKGNDIYVFNEETKQNIDKMLRFDETFLEVYRRVNNYSMKPKRYLHINEGGKSGFIRDALYMGLELEVDEGGNNYENTHLFNAAVSNYKPFLYSTSDASLRSGFETKTLPATLNALMDKNVFNWDLGFRVLKDRGYLSGDVDTCGLHIHLSKKFFTTPLDKFEWSDDELDKLGLAVLSILIENNWDEVVRFTRRSERRLEQWAPNRKILSRFKKQLLDEQTTTSRIFDIVSEIYHTYKGHSNAINNNKSNTYELRIFKGTINKTAFLASAQFASNLSHIARDLMKNIVIATTEEDGERTASAFKKLLETSFDDIINYNRYQELTDYVQDYSSFRD